MAEVPVPQRTTITDVAVHDPEYLARWKVIADTFKESAKTRRRKKTAKGKIKSRQGKGGKVFSYVDRPEYQIWLDENLPGWSIKNKHFWMDTINGVPALFNASVELEFAELGVMRTTSGVGSIGVSAKEFSKDNTTGLDQKYNGALTNAVKAAANWAGAFFDLRMDEDAMERAATPPTEEQEAEWKRLLALIPEAVRGDLPQKWATQNIDSAEKFLSVIRNRLEQVGATKQPPATGV